MSRKDRQDDWDNGMTVAPMNGDELPKYRRAAFQNRENTPRHKRQKSDVTRKEQRAMIRAMFEVMLPRILVVLVGFGLTALIIGCGCPEFFGRNSGCFRRLSKIEKRNLSYI